MKNTSHAISGVDTKCNEVSGNASLTSRTILQKEVAEILNKQFKDAKIKQRNSHNWGSIGSKVERAALQCEGIITLRCEESLSEYFERVLPALRSLAESYRMDTSDEDGYALGTVREVENALISYFEAMKEC
ncbi:hypothetical protein [Marinomonas sp.]